MCGLTGIISFDKQINENALVSMTRTITHRGPDAEGFWVSNNYKIGFGHRRLSIIDISETANQPMVDRYKRAVIAFNGEIYNYKDLFKELKHKYNVNFQTDHSDTEVLLQGYLTWGLEKLLKKLNGMFAFVIYDINLQKVFLVRDRIGIKPLYYSESKNGFIFSSEIKAILKHPCITANLDIENFYHHLTFRSLPAPKTLFKKISKLRPAEFIEVNLKRKKIIKNKYWHPLMSHYSFNSIKDAKEELNRLIHSSMDYRMHADVPVGIFLSGGIDSAYLLKLAKERVIDLNSYTVNYPEYEKYNENIIAKQLAEESNACYNEVPLTDELYFNALLNVSYFQDEPIAAPVCTSVYFLSKKARETAVPVVVGGEGSDEIFFGYEKWIKYRNLQYVCDKLPNIFNNVIGKTLNCFIKNSFSPYKEISARIKNNLPIFWSGAMDFGEAGKKSILSNYILNKVNNNSYETIIAPLYKEFLNYRNYTDISGWMNYTDIMFRLPELMLMRLDKMGMAFSIEGRVPYLDHRIIELVMSLPSEWRLNRGKETKAILKATMTDKLSKEFIYKKKRGFQAPVKEWKNNKIGQKLKSLLISFANKTEIFNIKALEELLNQKNDRYYFSLLNFMCWYNIFIERVNNELDVSSFK
ncbi:MAG: asparagine synthase (glutamine-hydrolyzing) [Halanaerobiales bacterium]|nr:asparagine synthase (glutamine-hydrolyzing) [Halanaerobiales bacterium]